MTSRKLGLEQSFRGESYAKGLARAFGGALIFAFPLLMTMEMWWLGFYMDPFRLVLFLLLGFAVIVGLSYYSGFEETHGLKEQLIDSLAAVAVGIIIAAAALAVFGLIEPSMPSREIIGKIAVQSVPASIGAVLARKQMGGGRNNEQNKQKAGYPGELFLMAAGALFLAFNVAPTEEMALIGYKMTHWHGAALALVSLMLLHALVYSVGFAGQEEPPGESGFWLTFFHFTLAGYGIALLVSLYVLWTFGRTDGEALSMIIMMTIVLGFPAALGAAIARLVI
jgi:putative integral membrane protein (TIGR02587 family)